MNVTISTLGEESQSAQKNLNTEQFLRGFIFQVS